MGRKYNRIMMWLAVFCVVFSLGTASAEGYPELASETAILMDAETGQVLYEKNSSKQMYPASITKIMTAMLALQELEPEQVLTVSQSAVSAVPITSSHISLLPGEQLTVREALYAIGMESANDAANVLGEAISGDLESFGRRMTEEARKLGAVSTNFTNSNGLPDSQHYTTAYDMALITAAALKTPGFSEYFSTVEHLFPATNLSDSRVFSNKDRLLPGGQYYYEGVVMAKTGWTTAAQGTFAAAVRRGDTTLIVIALKSPLLEDKYRDTHKLMDYGFSNFHRVMLTGTELAGLLELGDYKPAPDQAFSFLLPEGITRQDIQFSVKDSLPESDAGTVTVSAAVEGTILPWVPLQLVLPAQKETAAFIEAAEEFLEEALETVETSGPNWLLMAGAAVLLVYTIRITHRQYRRHLRRRTLRARIDRMKRQSR